MKIIKMIKNNKIWIICIILVIISLFIYANNYNIEGFSSEQYKNIHDTLLENLEKTIKIFKKYNIEYWAIGGTMLGSVRESKIIDKDDDIDLGVMEENYNKLFNSINNKDDLYNEFENNGLHLVYGWGIVKILTKREDNNYKKNKIFIDIMGIKEDNNKYIYLDKNHRNTWKKSWFYKNELFPLKKGNLNHLRINIPKKAENYLKRVYGDCTKNECWKIPTNEEPHHESEINLSI